MNTNNQRFIVVVDDDAPVRLALGRLLGGAGFGVETCASGEELLRLSSPRPVEYVVLDLHMAGVDGFEVLRRMAEAQMRTPVVVLTGRDSPEVRQRVLGMGVRRYLTKPVLREASLNEITYAMLNLPASPCEQKCPHSTPQGKS